AFKIMKKLIELKIYPFLLLLIFLAACEKKSLENFDLAPTTPTEVSAGTVVGNIVKSNELITIPVQVTLSTPAAKAFQVGVSLNADTVKGLIENNTLQGVSLLASNAIQLPSVIKVPYGASVATFEITVNVTAIE